MGLIVADFALNCARFYKKQTAMKKTAPVLLLFFILAGATWLRFHQWFPRLLSADDLWAYMLHHGDRFDNPYLNLYFVDSNQRFRFVFSAFMHVETWAFGTNLAGYHAVNIAVHSISGVTFCLIAFALCRSWVVSVLLGLIAVTARFSLYEVTQITGQVENLSLMFCMLSIWAALKADESTEKNFPAVWVWGALLCAFLSFNAHERYVVLLPWLAIFFVLHRRAGTIARRAAFVCVCAAMVAFNVYVKLFVLKANLIQATGGVPLAINLASIWDLLCQAVISILGMNHGNAALIGADWSEFSTPTRVAALAFAAVSLALMAVSLLTKRDKSIHWPRALLLLGALLLVPPVLTIRMEQRWELATFFMLLLIVSRGLWHVGNMRHGRYTAAGLLAILVISAAAIEARVSQSFNGVFFETWAAFSEAVKREIIDTKASKPGTPLLLVTDPGNCSIVLLYGSFFLIYEGKPRELHCVGEMGEKSPPTYPPGTRVYYENPPNQLTDVTVKWQPK